MELVSAQRDDAQDKEQEVDTSDSEALEQSAMPEAQVEENYSQSAPVPESKAESCWNIISDLSPELCCLTDLLSCNSETFEDLLSNQEVMKRITNQEFLGLLHDERNRELILDADLCTKTDFVSLICLLTDQE